MVLTGGGTGKTTVVVERVRHLLDADRSLTPENILVLTYNVRAAGELLDRFEQLDRHRLPALVAEHAHEDRWVLVHQPQRVHRRCRRAARRRGHDSPPPASPW